MRRQGLVASLIALGAIAALLVPSAGVAGPPVLSATYAGAGTVVAKQSAQAPLLDDGGAVCFTQQIVPGVDGLGGGCVSFPPDGRPAAIRVGDGLLADQVAFQVCVDMNQDGHCYMRVPQEGQPFQPLGPCDDRVGFSHADNGMFFNPLGSYFEPQPAGPAILKPLPTSIPPPGMCPTHAGLPVPRASWPGYVVFLCEGVHVTAIPHAHTPATGVIRVDPQPAFTGAGDFCQTIRDSFKDYFLVPEP